MTPTFFIYIFYDIERKFSIRLDDSWISTFVEVSVNSLRPSDAYMRQYAEPSLFQIHGLSLDRRQSITWINAVILLIGTLGTNFSEIFSEIHTFPFKKMHELKNKSRCHFHTNTRVVSWSDRSKLMTWDEFIAGLLTTWLEGLGRKAKTKLLSILQGNYCVTMETNEETNITWEHLVSRTYLTLRR